MDAHWVESAGLPAVTVRKKKFIGRWRLNSSSRSYSSSCRYRLAGLPTNHTPLAVVGNAHGPLAVTIAHASPLAVATGERGHLGPHHRRCSLNVHLAHAFRKGELWDLLMLGFDG